MVLLVIDAPYADDTFSLGLSTLTLGVISNTFMRIATLVWIGSVRMRSCLTGASTLVLKAYATSFEFYRYSW